MEKLNFIFLLTSICMPINCFDLYSDSAFWNNIFYLHLDTFLPSIFCFCLAVILVICAWALLVIEKKPQNVCIYLPASSRRSSTTFAGANIIGTLPVMPLDTPSTAVSRKIMNSLMIFVWNGCWTNTISRTAGIMNRRFLVLFKMLSSHRSYEYAPSNYNIRKLYRRLNLFPDNCVPKQIQLLLVCIILIN